MPRRYLFGPVTAAFADQHLRQARHAAECLAFGSESGLDLQVRPDDNWQMLLHQLPQGWRPDFIALYLPYTIVPNFLWSAPVPLVGLAADWNLLWHGYRSQLGHCALILTDTVGVDTCQRQGLPHVHAANLFGLELDFLDYPWPNGPRPLDILFVGNANPGVQSERLPWLSRLARLGDRLQVAIRTGVFGDDYRRLLGQSRIVFNRSIRGECNKRVFEAVAAGALLFQEAENREVPAYFRDRQECVYYTDDNLEELLTYYLEHEDERQAIAEAARAKVTRFGFEHLWQSTVTDLIEREWPAMLESAPQREAEPSSLETRTWQALSSTDSDPTLVADLAAALVEQPKSGTLHSALGFLAARAGKPQAVQTALGFFQRALAHQPDNVLAGLNAAECLVALNQPQPAIQQARHALVALDRVGRLDREALDTPHLPVAFDHFRVEWERAAWTNAGQPAAEEREKRRLLRWRLHFLLAELTGELHHYYEAALARPDLPVTQAMLGCALARAGQVPQAIPHLREAVASNPLDGNAARLLFQALGEAKDVVGQRRLARDRRLLAKAAPGVVPSEAWFAEAPPVGDELASILVLCCNELEYTRRCLESVLRHTRAPYELVIVDNGSTDGTPAFLEEFKQRPGPGRIAVIRNDSNQGFAAGCNQALAQAHGEYLVFLNNDTVVTPGWLDGLIAWSLSDWPNVGMVGAVTNYSRPPQQIEADYTDLTGMLPFAARRKQEFAGKALVVERLTGFCLLARRSVLEQLGGLDEGYGIGFFEDDDLSVRAREAGFKLLVALDVFIHHYGSRTFTGLGVNCQEQLRENFERFRDKWGDKHAAGYRVPEPAPPQPSPALPPSPQPVLAWPEEQLADTVARALAATPTAIASTTAKTGKAKVSLCMIVKNEEANLADCLGSVADLVDEVVVIDTGSTDKTKEIAQRFGAKIHDFPWVDSFAAARNESLKHATGDWVFWMDADDRVDEANRQKLRTLFGGLVDENGAYVMKCVCLPDPITKTVTVVDHLRLFRNHPEIRWQYRVHEQILPAIRRRKGEVRWSDVVVHHIGYQDPALRRRKLERDIRLLQLEDQEHPDDPFTLFNLGQVFQELGKPAEAIPVLRRSLDRSQPGDSIVRKLYALIAGCHRQLGQFAEAQAVCQEGRHYYPDDAELLFQESLVRREQKDMVGAEACLLKLLTSCEGDHFASIDAGLRGHKARHNLAILYQEQGRVAEAEAQWKASVAEAPGFAPAWMGLAELYVAQGRWADLHTVTEKLAEVGAPMESAVMQARGHLGRRDFAKARQLLGVAVDRFPQAVWPRRLLTHALLQEGSDPAASEQALIDLLALAPNDMEATNNLAVLRAKPKAASATPEQSPPPDDEPESLRTPAEQRLLTAREKGEPREIATALADMGTACLHEGDSRRAVPLLQEALALLRQLGEPERDVLDNLGMALATLGQLADAKPLLEEALAQARTAQDRHLERFILEHLGQVLVSSGDPAGALAYVEEGLTLSQQLGALHEETAMLWFTAILHAELGHRDQALARGQAAVQLMEKIGKPQARWYAEHLSRYQATADPAGLGNPATLVAGSWAAPETFTAQGPSLLRQAVTATRAMAAFVGSGLKTVSTATREERLRLCVTCEHHTGLRCRLCGCFTSTKTRLPYERCPVGKWSAER